MTIPELREEHYKLINDVRTTRDFKSKLKKLDEDVKVVKVMYNKKFNQPEQSEQLEQLNNIFDLLDEHIDEFKYHESDREAVNTFTKSKFVKSLSKLHDTGKTTKKHLEFKKKFKEFIKNNIEFYKENCKELNQIYKELNFGFAGKNKLLAAEQMVDDIDNLIDNIKDD